VILIAPWLLAAAAAGAPLRVRASDETAPCVELASRAQAGRWQIELSTGPLRDSSAADVLVGSEIEMTRALESGSAEDGSEVDLVRIPWVLTVASGNPMGLHGLSDLTKQHVDVWTLPGPVAYEARRALQAASLGAVREAARGVPRDAAVALVPQSLAAGRENVATNIPPVLARAAIATGTPRRAAATEFLAWLATETGRLGCVSPRP
jgi:hypothetical protein